MEPPGDDNDAIFNIIVFHLSQQRPASTVFSIIITALMCHSFWISEDVGVYIVGRATYSG